MARRRYAIPQYGTVIMAGTEYYRTRIEDADGGRVAIYGRTREELYDKVMEAQRQIENDTFRRSSPTVEEYANKWLLMQSAHIRATTLILRWKSIVKNGFICVQPRSGVQRRQGMQRRFGNISSARLGRCTWMR